MHSVGSVKVQQRARTEAQLTAEFFGKSAHNINLLVDFRSLEVCAEAKQDMWGVLVWSRSPTYER